VHGVTDLRLYTTLGFIVLIYAFSIKAEAIRLSLHNPDEICEIYENTCIHTVHNPSVYFCNEFSAWRCTAVTALLCRTDSTSVRPSFCLTRRYCVETAKHIIKLRSPPDSHAILAFPRQTLWQFSTGHPTPNRSVKYRWGMKKSRFSTNISHYLGNDTGWNHSYYETRIGNVTKFSNGTSSFNDLEWHNQDFKITPLFNAEYLRNGTRYRGSYNEILTGTYALLKSVISSELEWSWVT